MARKSQRIEANFDFDSVEKINSQFSKVKILVMYEGLNRNNSFISRDTVENALPTIFNIPVVGEFLEEVDEDGNFGSHGGRIEITDRSIKFINTTRPWGVVHESANPRWEVVKDRYTGEEKEYLVVDAYLWSGMYPELDIVLEKGSWQSMEISVDDYEWALMQDEDGLFKDVYKINQFEFNALCILGKSDNPENDIEPCFEDASITAYHFDKNEFQKQYDEMLHQLKFALDSKTNGGIEMDNVNDISTTLTDEEQVTEEVTYTETEQVDDTTENFEIEQTEETQTTDDETEQVEETEVEEENEITYSEVEYNALLGKITELENENEILKEYKSNKEKEEKQNEIDELFERFSTMLSDDEIQEIKEKALEMDLESLETKLYALVGKKKSNFSKPNKVEKMVVHQVDENISESENTEEADVYGEATKYFKKQ